MELLLKCGILTEVYSFGMLFVYEWYYDISDYREKY